MSERNLSPRRVVAIASSVLLVWCATSATSAQAAGEDDASFGDAGVVYAPIGSSSWVPPVVDQAPNGDVIAATGNEPYINRGGQCAERGTCNDVLQLARFTASGVPTGLSGGTGRSQIPVEGDGVLLDIGGMADGRIVVAGHLFPVEEDRGEGDFDDERLALGIVGADGEQDARATFTAPDSCGDKYRDAYPIAAEIVGLKVFVLWAGCYSGEVLASYDFADEDIDEVALSSFSFDAIDLATGPGGTVYTLARGTVLTRAGAPRGEPSFSIVEKFAQSDLEADTAWGEFGGVGALQGEPVDVDVDSSGRAVVWHGENQIRARGEVEDDTAWQFRRLDAEGVPDDGYGTGGLVRLAGDAFGPIGCVDEYPQDCPKMNHMVAMPDGRVVAMGFDDSIFAGSRLQAGLGATRTVIRLTAAGALDPVWDGDGIRSFGFTPSDSGVFQWVHAIALQDDGKVLVPFVASQSTNERVPAPEGRELAMGVARLNTDGATQTATPTAAGPAATAPAAGTAPQRAAARKPCTSRRRFAIRLRTGRRKAEQSPIVSATVAVNGRKVAVSRSARRTARVNLTNLPKGRFTVAIRLRLRDGGIVRETRRYRTCAPKVDRELAALRTRAPKDRRSRR